jgi:hypothetical protein
MAKSQKQHGNREARKPKQAKKERPVQVSAIAAAKADAISFRGKKK